MEKLTWEDKYGGVYMDGENVSLQDYDTATVCTGRAIDLLHEYELTGLTPEEIMDGKLLTGWISVEERLPEEAATVLISWGLDGHKAVQIGAYYPDSNEWSMRGYPVNVTHWMPLPIPPKGEE